MFAYLSQQDRIFQLAATTMTDQANDILQAAPATDMQIYVTGIYATNAHATTDTVVAFKQGTTTVKLKHYAAADGGGFGFTFPHPIPWGAGNSLEVANITDASNTDVSVTYFVSAA